MPIPLLADVGSSELRSAAWRTRDASQGRRLPALVAIYDGASRTEAMRMDGVTLQVVCDDWVLRFNARSPGGLIDRKAPRRPSRLEDRHRAALAASQRLPVALEGLPGLGGKANAQPQAMSSASSPSSLGSLRRLGEGRQACAAASGIRSCPNRPRRALFPLVLP